MPFQLHLNRPNPFSLAWLFLWLIIKAFNSLLNRLVLQVVSEDGKKVKRLHQLLIETTDAKVSFSLEFYVTSYVFMDPSMILVIKIRVPNCASFGLF